MDATYLDAIVEHHRHRAALDERDWRERATVVGTSLPRFASALRAADGVAVIAEVKRRSPSRGWLDEDLDAGSTARQYEDGGAAAVSVLTDETFFAGRPGDVGAVRTSSSLPVLRKDFTVSENDVVDTAALGAAACLLIVSALTDDELVRFVDLAGEVGLDALVEVHDDVEARRALDAGATLIGVNQRDLRTFDVVRGRAAHVVSGLPASVTTVAESGLSSREDVEAMAAAGVDAVLIGEAVVRASDREAMVRSLCGVAKVARV